MKESAWQKFFREKMLKIFTEKHRIIDIGGGLRVDDKKNNRFDSRNLWLKPYMDNVEYKILDKVGQYNPDIVGDIHELPFLDESVDAIICIAVLEHVEEPERAIREMRRVLKKGGYLYLYAPFLYYYHPMPGYYNDYYRFTYDGIKYLLRDFTGIEIQNVRGAIATLFNLLPYFSKKTRFFDVLDKIFGKENSRQTSGYNVFCIK